MKTSNRLTTALLALFTTVALASATLTGCSNTGKAGAGSPMQVEATATSSAGGNLSRSSSDDGQRHGEVGYLDGRKLKRNAWLTVEVDDDEDITVALDKAKKSAQAADGYVQSETSKSVTLMVPTERADSFLDELARLGEVTDRNVRVSDVTSEYVDLQIRIDNLEQTRQRLKQLLMQSADVQDVLEVEKELSRVTGELERLKGQMRTMSRETTYASVQLTVEEEITPGPVGWVFYGSYKVVKWLFVWG
jgi:predicted small secreted protein